VLIVNPSVEIIPGLWMLGTTAYPLYLVRGKQEGAIIEGGISALGALLKSQLAALGIGPDFVRQAVVTHAHPDHVMAVPLLRELFPGVQVVASAPAAAALGSDKTIGFFRQMDAGLTESLVKLGKLEAGPVEAALPEGRIAVDRVVREADVVAVEDISFSVLETPGHSPCSISLYDASQKILAISDATGYYLPAQKTWWPNYFAGYGDYLRSIQRLAGLDAEVLCLSHNGALVGAEEIRQYFAGAIAATRAYHERIVAQARDGKTVRQIAEPLGAEIHKQTPVLPLDFFQKNCGLLVKQSLRHEGIAVEK